MPKCPICGKVLRNPDSPSHINSKFHREAVEKGAKEQVKEPVKKDITQEKNPETSKEEIIEIPEFKIGDEKSEEYDSQLFKESLLDAQNYLKVNELEFLKRFEGDVVDSLVSFLKTEDYQVDFEDLQDFFHVIDLFLLFLSYEDVQSLLYRFNQDDLKYELKHKLQDIDMDYFATTSYGFDLAIHLISQYLSQKDLIEFLINFDELEDILEKSYYEVIDADTNPTIMAIEQALASGLKDKDQEVYNNTVLIINNSGAFFEHLKKELLNTFRVNQFITLKLVANRTNIYVKGELFNQCKYLLLNIQKSRIPEYDSIGSIDEAVERLDASMHGREGRHNIIDPETEFWGHCSNIQAWVENDYDTRILHRNLAFPLLRKLAQVGDPKAKKVYKDEIWTRFKSNYAPVIQYIFDGDYLNALNKTEINALVDEINLDKLVSYNYRHKQNLLLKFAALGSIKAKKLLSAETKKQLQTAKLTEMRGLLSRHYYTHLAKDDIMMLYKRFLKQKDKPGNEEVKIQLLGDFARLKVAEAKPLLKDHILKALTEQRTTAPAQYPYYRYARRHYQSPALMHLNVFTMQEIGEICDSFLSDITPNQYNEAVLNIISRFSDLGVSKARTAFKQGLITTIKEGQISTLERIATAHRLKSFTEKEIINICTNIDFAERFSENPRVTLSLLERFQKSGYDKADAVIKESIIGVLKNPNEININPVLNKTTLKHVTNEDIKGLLEAKDAKLVERLLTILQTTRNSSLKPKIVRFFTMVKNISGKLLSQKVKEALIETDTTAFHALLKAKVLSLLSPEDKEFLYDHPKCKLRNFVVTYEGHEYTLDSRFNMDLRNKGIKDITKVKGLNSLPNVQSLDLRDNHLTTIIGIGNLTKLKKLRLRGNNFAPRFLQHLGALDRYGNARDPQKFVRYSKGLEEGGITYISVGSKNLEVFGDELVLNNERIKSIDEIQGLSKIKKLRKLDLSHNQLKNVKGLETLTSLEVLNLSHNQLSSTEGLEGLVNLRELRLYGNGIIDFPEREHLPKLEVIDLDTRRKVSDRVYLNYLIESLSMEDIKQICREHAIRGYSGLRRDYLIRFTMDSLAEEEIRMVISNLEMKTINKGIDLALKKIEHKDREYVESIRIVNPRQNEVEIKFKGFNWETESYLSITPKTINNPERDCDCRIGNNMGFCAHFWVGVIFSLKAGFFKLSDWTLTPLLPNLEKRLSSFKVITDKSGKKRLINEKDNSAFLIEHLNSRVHVLDAVLGRFERRQYYWENKIITYYLNTIKNVKIAPEKSSLVTAQLDNLLVRFSENMFNKFELEKKEKIKLSGEVNLDTFQGLILKSVFVEGTTPRKRVTVLKGKQTKVVEKDSEEEGIRGKIQLDLNTIRDELRGPWWHHLSTEKFIFIQKIPVIENYHVNKDDILIHKEIRPGDRFPSVRYHIVRERGTKQIENADVKRLLIEKLVKWVEQHESLPPDAKNVKEYKNGNFQINYAPTSNVKFSLSVNPNLYGVDRTFFQRDSRTVSAPPEMEEPRFGAPSINQWMIESESDPNKTYTVTKHSEFKWSCTCPHHIFRRAECKHIREAMRRQNRI